MKFLQKYVLVPKEEWEKINPHLKNQKQLDIVREKNNTHPQKVVKKNSQVKKNLQVKNQIQNAVQVGKNLQKNLQKEKKILKKISKKVNQKKNKSLKSFIDNIKKEKKEYVNLLIIFINNNKKSIKWNSKGEFYYKNEKVLNSNIGKLIKHAVNDSKSQPTGMTKFYKLLAVLGVPQYLIINKKGKKIIDNYLKEKKYTWRPPGNLSV